jgi:hypothetical protein
LLALLCWLRALLLALASSRHSPALPWPRLLPWPRQLLPCEPAAAAAVLVSSFSLPPLLHALRCRLRALLLGARLLASLPGLRARLLLPSSRPFHSRLPHSLRSAAPHARPTKQAGSVLLLIGPLAT